MSLNKFSNIWGALPKKTFPPIMAVVVAANSLAGCARDEGIHMPTIPTTAAGLPYQIMYPLRQDPNLCVDGRGHWTYANAKEGIYFEGSAPGAIYISQYGDQYGGNLNISGHGRMQGAYAQFYGCDINVTVTNYDSGGTSITPLNFDEVGRKLADEIQRYVYHANFSANGAVAPDFDPAYVQRPARNPGNPGFSAPSGPMP